MKREKLIIPPKVNTCGGDINKKWFIYYSVKDHRDGKMKRFKDYTTLHKEKDPVKRLELAIKKAAQLKEKLLTGWTPFNDTTHAIYADQLQYKGIADIYGERRGSNKTVNYFASKYLERITSEKSHATMLTYRSKLRTFNLWIEKHGHGNDDISVIDNGVVTDFFLFMIDVRKLSGNSIKKYKQMLFGLFEFAIDKKALYSNPVYNIPKCNRINDHAPRVVHKIDIEPFRIAITAEDPQLWLAIEMQFYCYVRPGDELRFLKIGNIDFTRGLIYIDREIFKTRRENIKEIPEHFLLKLRNKYKLHNYPRNYFVFGKSGMPGIEHLSKNNLRMRFVKFRKKLNMPFEYKFYSWKHTGGVMASDAGIPIDAISDQMGHTTLTTTSAYLKAKGGRRLDSIRSRYPEL